MAKIKPFISSVVARQLPEFIRDEYPSFVNFVEAYYEYVDANHNGRNLKDYKDLDDTLDSFVQYFRNELNVIVDTDYPNYDNINEKLVFIQKAKQYYSAKGSEAAYKFLFRALYDTEIELYYPSADVLRASDGKWQQDVSFFITVESGSIDDIVGKEVQVYNSAGVKLLSTFVDRYVVYSSTVYEIVIGRYEGVANIGNTVKYSTTFSGTIVATIGGYNVVNGGGGFSVGQIYDINTIGVTGARIKITQVSSTGAIQKLKIIKFGAGYSNDFVVNIAPVVTDYEDTSPINVSLNSVEQFESPSNTYTQGFAEQGTIINSNYYDVAYGDATYVGTLLGEFSDTYTFESDTENVASIKFNIAALAQYAGYYSDNDGFVSDAIFIQDSYYYQAFSYEVKITELLDNYVNLVKSYIHPSGTILFANYIISNQIDLATNVGPAALQTRLYLSDSTSASDVINSIVTNKYFTDTASISEALVKEIDKAGISETITETDAGSVILNGYSEGSYFAESYAAADVPAATF